MVKSNVLFLIIILIPALLGAQRPEPVTIAEEECTIGVATGVATADGRPMIWKTRDTSSKDNEVKYNTSFPVKFISVISAGGTYAWMGVNEHGFAILNSNSVDIDYTEIDNGSLMRDALGTCSTLPDFEQLLDSTNAMVRDTHANFAVFDSTGAAAIYETGNNFYVKYDAHDPALAPDGYILRTNFTETGNGSDGIERFYRTTDLVAGFFAGDSLNVKSILRTQMRDFSDFDSAPVAVPYPSIWIAGRPWGYIYAGVSICRTTSVSATVIQGIKPGEPAYLSTMWTILGQPAGAIAVPYWPAGPTPAVSDGSPTAPLCDVARDIQRRLWDYTENENYINSFKLRDQDGGGIWPVLFPAEDSILTAADSALAAWRLNPPAAAEMLAFESSLADYALRVMQGTYDYVTGVSMHDVAPVPRQSRLLPAFPNPFNPAVQIRFRVAVEGRVRLKIYNALGQESALLLDEIMNPGEYSRNWSPDGRPAGVYFVRLTDGNKSDYQKIIYLK